LEGHLLTKVFQFKSFLCVIVVVVMVLVVLLLLPL
jgi:hypothetical protein